MPSIPDPGHSYILEGASLYISLHYLVPKRSISVFLDHE